MARFLIRSSLAMQDKDTEALADLQGAAARPPEEQDAIEKLMAAKLEQAKLTSDGNTVIANTASRLMLILMVAGAILAIGLGLFITSIVQGQLGADPSEVADIANRVAVGDMSLTIDMHGKERVIRSWPPCRRWWRPLAASRPTPGRWPRAT